MSEEKEEPKLEEKESPKRKELSPEEIKKEKRELSSYYKAELPLLKLQAEYEECITRIDVAKMQRFEIMLAKAQMMAPPPGENNQSQVPPSGEHEKPKKTERKLKVEK